MLKHSVRWSTCQSSRDVLCCATSLQHDPSRYGAPPLGYTQQDFTMCISSDGRPLPYRFSTACCLYGMVPGPGATHNITDIFCLSSYCPSALCRVCTAYHICAMVRLAPTMVHLRTTAPGVPHLTCCRRPMPPHLWYALPVSSQRFAC